MVGLAYYEALDAAGYDFSAIKGLSIRPRAVVLTVTSKPQYERLLVEGFDFQRQHVACLPLERTGTTSVHVFVDAGVPDNDLLAKLNEFGTAIGGTTHRYDVYKGHKIDSGVRYVNMVVKRRIPCFVEIPLASGGSATCRLWHAQQVQVCRRCKKDGHIARNCPLKGGNNVGILLNPRRPRALRLNRNCPHDPNRYRYPSHHHRPRQEQA